VPVVALTGATGFIGRAVVRRLAASLDGTQLRLLVRDAPRRRLPVELTAHEIVAGSLDSADALRRLVAGADTVVHVAGSIAGSSAEAFDRVNVVGTRRVAEAIRAVAPAAHCIHVSSLAARVPAVSWYAASKRAGEEIVRTATRHCTVVRPPAVYGPEDPALAPFWRLLARGWLVRPGPADARFSLVHADDLAEAVARLHVCGPPGRIVTIAGPQPECGWRWSDIAQAAADARGGPVRTLRVPRAALTSLASLAGAWGRISKSTAVFGPGKARELLHPDWVCDNLELETALGWQPTTRLQQALGTLPGWSSQ